jgi:hypothetical protein
MDQEKHTCQNCKGQFAIEPEDFDFYKKIAVPPPTFCPRCRHVRRLVWTHAFNLYRRTCNVPGHTEEIIAKYPASSPVTVYDARYWWSDAWDPLDFGFTYDFTKPFFEQLRKLHQTAPVCNSDVKSSVNCDYCITAHNCKNCYFIGGGFRSEDCLYDGDATVFCKNVVDSGTCLSSDTLYECVYCDGSFNLKYSAFCEGCMDSAFLYDCKGCSDCFGCVNLRNKKYYIFNQQYSKDEYREKIKEFALSSYSSVRKLTRQFAEFKLRYPHRFANLSRSVNCTGDSIEGGKNCRNCFEIRQGAENCKYVFLGGIGIKDSQDVFGGGLTSALIYESRVAMNSEQVFFSDKIFDSTDIYYSLSCDACSDLFACIGLRHKKYCIFNRQYSKEEYDELVPKIIKHMGEMPFVDGRGITYGFGEFPPSSLSPLPYNESTAQAYYPLNAETAHALGYNWMKPERRDFTVSLRSADIPDSIAEVEDSITDQVIECEHKDQCEHNCLGVFKIVPQELQFYRHTGTPLPHFCPTCRYLMRLTSTFKSKSTTELFKRTCQCAGTASQNGAYKNVAVHAHGTSPCAVEFETPYPSERPEIVYCESCYYDESV